MLALSCTRAARLYASSAARARVSPARQERGACAHCRGFESGADTGPAEGRAVAEIGGGGVRMDGLAKSINPETTSDSLLLQPILIGLRPAAEPFRRVGMIIANKRKLLILG